MVDVLPITNLLSVLCVLVDVLSRAHAKSEKSLNGFRFGTSVAHFSSDGAASTAVKGLKTLVSRGDIYRTLELKAGVSYDVT